MDEKIAIIYTKQTKADYLYYIKENFALIKKLFEEKKNCPPYSKDETSKEHKLFYQCKAKHIQMMTTMGINAEHILKIILLKNGYIINKNSSKKKFTKSFLEKIKTFEETNFDDVFQEEKALNIVYNEANNLINDWGTIGFYKCIELFKNSIKNDKKYFNSIKKYTFNIPREKILVDGRLLESNPGPIYDYLGFKEIDKNSALEIIREMRNNYIHVAGALFEQQGIIHYLYNFLLYLCVKEFKGFFIDEKYLPEMKAKIEKLFPSIEDI